MQPILRKCSKVILPKKKFVRCMNFLHEKPQDSHREILPTSETVIRTKLKASSIAFTDGYTCFHVQRCSLCPGDKKRLESPDIFINKKTGFFVCNQCKITGNWSAFRDLLQKGKSKEEVASIKEKCFQYKNDLSSWQLVFEASSSLEKLDNASYEKIFKDFRLPFCPKHVIGQLEVRISKQLNVLYFPMFSGGKVVGYKTFDVNGGSVTVPKSECVGVLLSPHKTEQTAVVVAEIPDFLAILSQNLPVQIVCLPYGNKRLPQSILPWLEPYSKIILWLGILGPLDVTGNFAVKLNNQRCFNIRGSSDEISAVTALSQKKDLRKILENAKSTHHQFITTFNSLREEVFDNLQNRHKIEGVTWKRFPGLNKILKGHRRGELTVLTGPTGSGKTTFMSEYSLDLAMQGVNTLWGSFEIKNSRLLQTMLRQFSGIPLDENLEQFDFWADKFEMLPLYFMTFHGQQPLSTVMETVEHCSYINDIAHVIIDNVQFMIEILPNSSQLDRFWKQDCLIQCFRSFASKSNCHVTLVMHPRKGMEGEDLGINSIFGGGKAVQEADNVFIIQKRRQSAEISRKYLQVCKNRFSGELGAIPLDFNKINFSFAQKSSTTVSNYFLEPQELDVENTKYLETSYRE